ncbi:hypothetical protein [Nocardioides marinquilinus]
MASPPAALVGSDGVGRVVTIAREPGSLGYLGQRPTRVFAGDEVALSYPPNHRSIALEMERDGETYEIEFLIPHDQTWVEGRTYRAAGAPGRGSPWTGMVHLTSNHTSCGGSPIAFTVHEMLPDLSRFRIGYTVSCGAGWTMNHGEVLWGTDGGVETSPEVRWPDAEVGERLDHGGGVLVANAGETPLVAARAPYLTGRHAGDYRVTGTCDVVSPGSSCYATVAVAPRAPGEREASWHLPLADGGEVVVPLRTYAFGGITRWRSVKTYRDGRRVVVRGGPDSDVVVGSEPLVGDDDTLPSKREVWALIEQNQGQSRFTAPRGRPLRVGRYGGADHSALRDDAAPGINVARDYSYCTKTQAAFHVHEIAVDEDGDVARLAVSYTQACGGFAIRGYIAFRAQREPALPLAPRLRVLTPDRRYRRGETADLRVRVSGADRLGLTEVRVHRDGRVLRTERRPVPPSGVVVVRQRVLGPVRVSVRLVDEPWTAAVSRRLLLKG